MIEQKYKVYFTVFGKKLKHVVMATSKEEAKKKVLNAVEVDAVRLQLSGGLDDLFNDLKDIVNGK